MDKTIFDKYIEQKLISVQKHPTEELYIYNYTQKCQFERVWDEVTMMCRGLILDDQGNIIARPFSKFFNYEEHIGEDSKLPKLPLEEFEVFDKLDGSLGILYFLNGRPTLATRGSFISDQAIMGTNILNTKEATFNPDYTYLFEIIYPENRIVVDYKGLKDVILLTAIVTKTGEEISYTELLEKFAGRLSLVDRFDGILDLTKIKELGKANAEGFVVRFKNGVRTKVKLDEYVRLHRLVTGVNAKTIWEHLKDGTGVEEMLERVPDEFNNWVRKTIADLLRQYQDIESTAKNQYREGFETRKDAAFYFRSCSYPSIMFNLLDGKDYSDTIWKLIRPVAEKPWKEDIDA